MLLNDTFIKNMTASFHIVIAVNDSKTLKRASSAGTFGFLEQLHFCCNIRPICNPHTSRGVLVVAVVMLLVVVVVVVVVVLAVAVRCDINKKFNFSSNIIYGEQINVDDMGEARNTNGGEK
jgi:hypothetical protein